MRVYAKRCGFCFFYKELRQQPPNQVKYSSLGTKEIKQIYLSSISSKPQGCAEHKKLTPAEVRKEVRLRGMIMATLKIVVSKNIETVRELAAQGYCPVECSFGSETVVDELMLDHHGRMSHLESVAIRAYRDFFGACAEDPRFVINHIDADCIFAVASLAGLLPHPQSRYAATLPAFLQKTWQQDLLPLAETIAVMDTDPIGRDVLAMPFGATLITWNALFGANATDELSAYAAVEGWRRLLTQPSTKAFVAAAEKAEAERRTQALADLNERGSRSGKVMAICNSRVFGFAEWYDRRPEAGQPTEAKGWGNPIVVALVEATGVINFGMPNKAVAEEVFGEGGLTKVFKALNELYGLEPGNGFGGREAIGGSPRGRKMTETDLKTAVEVINGLLEQK